ncbi:MAG TPA: type III polyketide synthase, partial [Allosphingosinicella sp.]|nr:type III polyketide synthase [Allosphingosinicella sp.]
MASAVPAHDVHDAFIRWAQARLGEPRLRALFARMAARSGIEHRWSVLPAAPYGGSPVDPGGFYGGKLPSTAVRMQVYAQAAPKLALEAIRRLDAAALVGITHLIVASCTGFVAPGIDQIIAAELGLGGHVERTLVGFMGCYAAVSS